ncbi:hypothetical protein CY34DRAFT_720807 [Suillus luteus UH-Slu-Lm8-n1]|uniref:Unplaced genomic scaffold CY34scaffold_86, whole genome shotgun sequence n=1 Tax=Suillus luteus UH-Slu-Lm8-n1 TaxID=930992 RepID=A0A0C9ZZZ0_9AGAM|nr:hypothetical protein CY34DRAFT_720807 [Suillus luteus UH-Slu-Lm8-n1]
MVSASMTDNDAAEKTLENSLTLKGEPKALFASTDPIGTGTIQGAPKFTRGARVICSR